MSKSERRFEVVRRAVISEDVVGYLSYEGQERVFNDLATIRRYYLTQYALAPVVVASHPNYRLVIGNFPDEVGDAPPIAEHLRVVRRFGSGVWLLQPE